MFPHILFPDVVFPHVVFPHDDAAGAGPGPVGRTFFRSTGVIVEIRSSASAGVDPQRSTGQAI